MRLCALEMLYRASIARKWTYKRLPRHRSGYKHYWVDDKVNVLGMRSRIAELPAVDRHPTIQEVRREIGKFEPQSVLEAGCGYGRLLEGLTDFPVEGCDLAEELVSQARSDGLNVFQQDIVADPLPRKWDVIYTRAVFMFMVDHADDTLKAMQHLDQAANKKVIIWEWPHVCDYMRSVYPSDKFEYHSTPVTAG